MNWKRIALLTALTAAPVINSASTITLSGLITQSTSDGTGPAVNNPALNSITDGQPFTVTLVALGAITGTGNYSGSSLTFSVPATATESNFSGVTLSITSSGGLDALSLLGCLNSGSGCALGNQLTANFQIPAGQLNATGVTATGLDQPHPLDLLEDDGTTDIQGSIGMYSYAGPASSPTAEPSAVLLVLLGGGWCVLRKRA